MLDYGEPQILELFKNTVPSRLYYMVYNINRIREALKTAKCMLIKEQIDGHKSGQANSSLFLKVNQQNSKKKGVTFNAMETIQKQGDSIDKLTSLMNELSSKLDKKGNPPQYKPRIHPGRNRECRQRQNRYKSRDRSYSRDMGPYNNNNRNKRNYQNQNHYGLGNNRNRSRDFQNNRSYHRKQNSSKGMTKDLDIEMSVENVTDPGPGIEVPQEKTLELDIEIIKVEVGKDKGPELLLEKET